MQIVITGSREELDYYVKYFLLLKYKEVTQNCPLNEHKLQAL